MRKQVFKAVYDFKVDKKFWDTISLSVSQQNTERSKPASYLKKTIEIARILGLSTVVEIGSNRSGFTSQCHEYYNNIPDAYISPPCCNDGHSAIIWALENFEVHTVDINELCINQIKLSFNNIQRELPPNLHMHIPKDGIEFLKEFNQNIDILFLDGWDVGTGQYREKHLEAFLAAKDKLSETHLILIDDTDFRIADGGKDAILTPHLIADGYFMLFNGRQTLFINKI